MKILWLSLLLAGLCLATKEEEVSNDIQEIEGRRLQRTGSDSLCHGCSTGGDKFSSSSIVVPNINLPNILGEKTDIVHQAFNSANDFVGQVEDPAQDLLLKIGDIISFFSSATNDVSSYKPSLDLSGHTGINTHDLSDIAGSLGGLAGSVAVLEKLGSLFSIVHLIKYKVLHAISAGLQIANFVLAIVGLAMLIGYVVENDGKLGVLSFGLTGEGESGTGYGSGSGSGGYSGTGGYARSFTDSPAIQGLTNLVYDAISKYD